MISKPRTLISPTKILLLGDTHGDTNDAQAYIQLAHNRGCQAVLQLGDFGFIGQGVDRFIYKVNRTLERLDMYLYWVDGNHENHDRLESIPLNGEGLRPIANRIYHLPRGFRWEWQGIKFLACGGAYSIDKGRRKAYVSWWPQETITQGDVYRCGTDLVDVLVSHDVPWGVLDPYGPQTGGGDKDLWPTSTANRKLLRAVLDNVDATMVIHGHTHHRKSTTMLREDGSRVQVEGYACNGMEGHADVWDLKDAKETLDRLRAT